MNILKRIAAAVRGAPLPLPQRGERLSLRIARPEMDLHPGRRVEDQLAAFTGWVYAAARVIADDVAKAVDEGKWDVWRKIGDTREDWVKVPKKELPNQFMLPNPMLTFAMFVELTQIHLELTGSAYWRALGDDPAEAADGFEIVYPHWIEDPVVTEGILTGWRISIPGASFAGANPLPSDELAFVRYPHPTDPLRGFSPVESYAASHNMDRAGRAYGAALLENNAVPTVVLTTQQELTSDQKQFLSDGWKNRHYRKPGEPAVLDKGGTAQLLGMTLDKLGLDVISKMTREQVFAAHGIPGIRAGFTEDLNRATSFVAMRTYQEGTLEPRFRRIQSALDWFWLPRVGLDPTEFAFLFESPVREDQEFRLEQAEKGVKGGILLVNEGRRLLGQEETPDGDVYLVPANTDRIPAGSLATAPPRSEGEGQRGTHFMESDRFELVELRFTPAIDRLERSLAGQVRALFSRDQVEVIKALKANFDEIAGQAREFRLSAVEADCPAGLSDADKITLALEAVEFRGPIDNALNINAARWAEVMNDHIFAASRAGWQLFEAQVPDAADFSLVRQRALNRARRISAELVSGTQRFTQIEIRRIIIDGVEKGESVNTIAGRLRAKFDNWKGHRARTIAQTETAGHVNFGLDATAKETERQTGRPLLKTWVTTLDGAQRDSHTASHGQTVPSTGVFQVGIASLRFPADRGPAEETINCRCTLSFREERR
jgi:phage portal protein BeeE